MEETANNEAKNSSKANLDDDPYSEANGKPLTCPQCGEYVVVNYHPHKVFFGDRAGFVVHCACAAGPKIDVETVNHFLPLWYASIVAETEENPEKLMEYYLHDNLEVSDYFPDEEK